MIKVTRVPSSLLGFFSALKHFFSPAQWHHFRFLVLAIAISSGRRTIRNLRVNLPAGYRHRTNLHEFVVGAAWDGRSVLRQAALTALQRMKPRRGETIYLILDDTKIEKLGRGMDALGHYGGPRGKRITGHAIVTAVILFRGVVIPWDLELQDPKRKARTYRRPARKRRPAKRRPFVKMTVRAARMIESFPALPWKPKVVVLFDSFYLCRTVVQACQKRHFAFVSRVKSNRNIVVRQGRREESTKIAARGKRLFRGRRIKHLVRGGAQGTRRFHTFGEVATLSKVGEVKLVFSKEYQRSNKIVCLVSSATKMTNAQVIHTYAKRWWIEVFFKEAKQHLGLGDYQTGHYNGIQKHLYLVSLAFVLLTHVRLDGRRAKGKSKTKKKKTLLAPVAVKTSCDTLRQIVFWNELKTLAPRKKAARATFMPKLNRLRERIAV
jgi:SRSO17 transposase